jgi:hypothetical protein
MSEVLNIYQYQSVVYNSTTTGATPLTFSWSFPGGSPTAGTGSTRTVFYNVPGVYSVTLTATDVYGTTDSLVETNIINVDPVSITPGISGPIPATVKMNEGYDVYDNSTGNPYPAISWYWQLPYGITASTQNVGVTGYIDWYTLTGTYSGAPGSSYNADIYLTVNNGYSPATATTTVEVQKLGPIETIGLNATGGVGTFTTQTGLAGGMLTNPMLFPLVPAPLSLLGYPGTGATAYAFHVDLRLRTGSPVSTRLNQNFHSTNEAATASISTGFYTDVYLTSPGFEVLGGFLIINSYVYSNYSTIPVNTAISSGEYIIQGQSYDFYLADANPTTGIGGILTEVYNNRNYSISLIDYLITNPYKLVFSGNIQYINNGGVLMTFPDNGFPAGPGSNPVVYSPTYLASLGASGAPGTPYEVYTSVSIGPTTFGATASFVGIGGTGNDPVTSGNFFVAQDNLNGPGFVSYLNQSINSSIPGGTGTIVYEAQEFFNCDYTSPTGAGYNPSNYYGVALKVVNKQLVQNVTITDNSATLSVPGGPTIAPFTADTLNSQGSTETCSGMFTQGIQIFPAQNNFLTIGGSIVY